MANPMRARDRVAENVARRRQTVGLTLAELSKRLDKEQGHPLGVTVLSKIEGGTRGIDVDDLMALAGALDTTVTALLQPNIAELPAEVQDLVQLVQRLQEKFVRALAESEDAEARAQEAAVELDHAKAQLEQVVLAAPELKDMLPTALKVEMENLFLMMKRVEELKEEGQ